MATIAQQPDGAGFTRLIEALERSGQRVTGSGRQRKATCPAHDDANPSLSITDGNSRVLVKCQAGCDTGDVLAALGLTFADLGGESKPEPSHMVVAEYRYTDEQGELLYVKERRQPKDFRVRRPDGKGGWAWGLGASRRVLYRLAELPDAIARGRTVYVVEGEKDADRLAALGEVATCNHDGAARAGQRPKWRPEYGNTLRGADVVIIADRDEPGEAHARAIAADLSSKAKSVVIVQAAVTTAGADVSDHLDAGYGLDDLVPLDGVTTTELSEPLPGIPSFPVTQITGPLRSFLDWGVADGLHPECVAAAGLAALVTLTGPARLRFSPAKVVKPVLWIALVGIASSGKSAAFEHAFAELRAVYAQQHAEYQAELESWRETVEAQGRKAAGLPPARPEPLELDDVTTEAVARWLQARGDASGAVIDDELAAFLEGLNQYKGGQGSDLSKWLKMWTGAPLHVQRVGKGGSRNEVSLYVPDPVVSVAGPLVPANLHLLGKPGSGFRPRWLPFYAPARPPEWHKAGDYPDDWKDCVSVLAECRGPREWELSAKSRALWKASRSRWHEQQSGAEPDDVIEALRKADTQCLRIALVLAESIAPANPGEVPADAMKSAIAIVDYCIDVWRCLPGNSTMTVSRREDVMDAAHRRLITWLESRPEGNEGLPEGSQPRPRATRRELQRWLHEPPAKISELILEHRRRWPGCVIESKPQRGPATTYIYAPERISTAQPKLSRRQFPDRVCTPTYDRESAGQHDLSESGETVAPTVASPPRQLDATVSPHGAPAPAWPASETGPCRRCGQPCHRYGDGGSPLCEPCRAAEPMTA
jgi:5S rRNA maturation endonuclease (ribonuclease M5)